MTSRVEEAASEAERFLEEHDACKMGACAHEECCRIVRALIAALPAAATPAPAAVGYAWLRSEPPGVASPETPRETAVVGGSTPAPAACPACGSTDPKKRRMVEVCAPRFALCDHPYHGHGAKEDR